MIGAEAFGLYCVDNKDFIKSIVKGIFDRRKEIYLIEGSYNYDEYDEHDILNCKLRDNFRFYAVSILAYAACSCHSVALCIQSVIKPW